MGPRALDGLRHAALATSPVRGGIAEVCAAPVVLTCQGGVGNPTEGAVMAVLIRHRAAGMNPSQYDEISPPLVEKLKTQPGFMIHVAFVDNGRFTVSEIWESQEQHDRWFNENVQPNVPGVEQEVIELHAVHTP
jgi:hypothetical protein